jgi:hypothetical protein
LPFRNFELVGDRLRVGAEEPDPKLEETDDPKVGTFILLESFCYRVAAGDPESETVYVVPGADAPPPGETTTDEEPPRRVVIPPTDGGRTDLASVPSFLWWLIASYGNHTRAALLHDALYVDKGQHEPAPRSTADRLFLTALREPGQKTGTIRHWLMWVGVSLFGTMPRLVAGLFVVQVLAIWGLLVAAVAWAWGSAIWDMDWTWWEIVIAVAVIPAFLLALGTSWRAGVDLMGGWLAPDAALAAVLAVPLALRWTWPPKHFSPFMFLLAAGALMLLGLLWGGAVDPTLRMWLWPTALIGLPLAMLPVVLIALSVGFVWFIDFGAAIAAAPRKDAQGNRRGLKVPAVKPLRTRL